MSASTDSSAMRSATAARPPGRFFDDVRTLLGARYQTGEAVRRRHGSSEAHFAVSLPDGVAYPRTTEEVVQLVNLCTTYTVPLVPFGAGTSLEGNVTPVQGGISIDLSEMNQVIAVDAESLDCAVQAGVRRQQLNEHLRDTGLFFPIDPGADATIGGMAATRASGTNAVRYGTMKDAVLALRVVTPDGRDIRTGRRARKSAAGYDLTRLMIGSEGTLGIITEVTLRLHGIPEVITSAVCSFHSLEGAVTTVVESIQSGVTLARVELLDDKQINASNAWSKLDLPELATLFFEFHGSPASVEEQVRTVEGIAASNGGGEFSWSALPEERTRLWKARHEAYYAAVNVRPGGVGWVTDVCVPLSQLCACITETKVDLAASRVPATIVGHVGDGNFHVVFSIDPASKSERDEVEELNARLVERALSMDGTCTGEHGIGLGKQKWLVAELGDAVASMRLIKQALDPHNLFNPGKIFSQNET